MNEIKSHKDLFVWQKSMKIVTEIYRLSKEFPSDETFGLISQIRRCAVSIPSNIAEGFGRRSTADYKRFLCIASGSLCELQTQIEIANNLDYLNNQTKESIMGKAIEIEKMLNSYIRKLK